MIIEFINRILGILVPVSLLLSGICFSFKLNFFRLLSPRRIIRSMFGESGAVKDSISPFRAVTVALAGLWCISLLFDTDEEVTHSHA